MVHQNAWLPIQKAFNLSQLSAKKKIVFVCLFVDFSILTWGCLFGSTKNKEVAKLPLVSLPKKKSNLKLYYSKSNKGKTFFISLLRDFQTISIDVTCLTFAFTRYNKLLLYFLLFMSVWRISYIVLETLIDWEIDFVIIFIFFIFSFSSVQLTCWSYHCTFEKVWNFWRAQRSQWLSLPHAA